MENSALLNIDEVCKLLNVKKSWVRTAVHKKKIPYIKVNHLIRFDKNSIEKWIGGNTNEVK